MNCLNQTKTDISLSRNTDMLKCQSTGMLPCLAWGITFLSCWDIQGAHNKSKQKCQICEIWNYCQFKILFLNFFFAKNVKQFLLTVRRPWKPSETFWGHLRSLRNDSSGQIHFWWKNGLYFLCTLYLWIILVEIVETGQDLSRSLDIIETLSKVLAH